MATILATANGNWSASGTWVGGVVPTTGDIAVLNNKTVTVDVSSITCSSIRNDTTGGATAGGTLVLSLDSTAINADLITSTATMLTVPGGKTVTGLGAITGPSAGSTVYAINISGGDVTCTTVVGGTGTTTHGILMARGTLSCTSVTGGSGSNGHGISMSGGTVSCTTVTGGAVSNVVGISLSGGSITCTSVTGGSGSNGHGISMSGGTVSCTTVKSGSGSSNNGISQSGGTVICTLVDSDASSAATSVNMTGGILIADEIRGNGYGSGGSGSNVASLTCTANGRAMAKKITFGSLGQCPISGHVRLLSDATNAIYIPLDADYPSAGSGANPNLTALANTVILSGSAELLRTVP